MQVCPNCGEENPDRFRLCGLCGTELAPELPPQEVRKTITVVFSDLKGSTSLAERFDPESLREALNFYFNEMRSVVERHGGRVDKYIGDAIVAVFGLPTAHEDDAQRAVRAAAEMKATLPLVNERIERLLGARLENRTGVYTGEVVAGDVSAGQYLTTGDTMNTAARLEAAAPSNEILIGEPTYRLVRHTVEVEAVEPLTLKGKTEPVPAFRLLSVSEGEGIGRRLDTPMVGRVDELRVLTDALARATSLRRTELVTVIGPAGVGKSRLLQEFLRTAGDDVASIHGRCLSYGEGITFFPLAEMVRDAAGIEPDDPLDRARSKLIRLMGPENVEVAQRISATIGLSAAAFSQEETFWAVRRFLERLAERGPHIAVIDDIQWAEQTFLDLLTHLRESLGNVPVVLVCSSRPEIREEHPEWLKERDNAHVVVLASLSDDESSIVVDNLLGAAALDEPTRARIVAKAQGNPLFVEQLLSMLIDDGILQRDPGGGWVAASELSALSMPPSINALLTARLDRLGPSERAVIERGAVVGSVFFRGAVEELAPESARNHVGTSLTSLVRKEFIRPHESEFAGQESYTFLHELIRDAAYHSLLKRTRAELHERFVDWAERVAVERVMEYEEILGYHLEQAFLILVQVAPNDDHARAVGIRGSRYLASAGHRALARGDMPAAASLLHRAASLLPAEDPARPRLLMEAGEAFMEAGDFLLADASLLSAIEGASALWDEGLETSARLLRVHLHYATRAAGSEEELLGEVQKAIPLLEQLGDHQGLARAWRLLALVNATAGRFGAAERAAHQAIEHAVQAGDSLMEARVLPWVAMTAMYGPTPVAQVIARCEEILERVTDDRKAQAHTLRALALLQAMQGSFDQARLSYRRSRANLEELGWKLGAAMTSLVSGVVEMLAGDPAAAERELRRDYEAYERMGERNYISTTAGDLAEALYRQGRYEEAEGYCQISRELAAPEDVTSQVRWRCVRGKILARRGRSAEAEALVREALDIIRGGDEPDSHGNALMDLAEVLQISGRIDEAASAMREAAELFDVKGNVVSLQRAQAFLSAVRGPGGAREKR